MQRSLEAVETALLNGRERECSSHIPIGTTTKLYHLDVRQRERESNEAADLAMSAKLQEKEGV